MQNHIISMTPSYKNIDEIEKTIMNNANIDIAFVENNQDLIKEYFLKNYNMIRNEFLKNPIIGILNYHTEEVKFNNKNFELIGNNDIVKCLAASTMFLTNITKICLFYIEIYIKKLQQNNSESIVEEAISNLHSDFKVTNHDTNCQYSTITIAYIPSISIKHKNTNQINEIYIYIIDKLNNKFHIESMNVSAPPIEITNNLNTYMILEHQALNYVYTLINVIFFIKKQNEHTDPGIILTNTQLNITELKQKHEEAQQIFIKVFSAIIMSILIKTMIDGVETSNICEIWQIKYINK